MMEKIGKETKIKKFSRRETPAFYGDLAGRGDPPYHPVSSML